MPDGSSDNPFEVTSEAPPAFPASSVPYNPEPIPDPVSSFQLIAFCEIGTASVMLLISVGLLYLAAEESISTISDGAVSEEMNFRVPILQACLAIVVGVPGLLLLMAGRSALRVAAATDVDSIKRMQESHRFLLFCTGIAPFVLISVLLAFVRAFTMSSGR